MSLSKALELFGVGEEWRAMPWKVFVPLPEQWKNLPTFLLCEYGYRATSWLALLHATQTDRVKSWMCGWLCGTANDIFFMFMPFCDNFWQAQAHVMITPRLPLYIVEMYASVMYYPATAASIFSRWAHIPPSAQACLTGLLAHVFYGVYDVNGPKYLWWTWHDGDPAIRERNCNAPYGSSLWILTYCGLQSFLNAWMLRGPGATIRGKVAPTNWDLSAASNLSKLVKWLPRALTGRVPTMGMSAATTAAVALDKLQAWLNKSSDATQILFRGAVATPVFMAMMGVGQVFSLDKLGIPGKRTYYLMLAAMIGHVANSVWKGRLAPGRGTALGSGLPEAYRKWNYLFLAAVAGHFALFTALNVWGKPEEHVSTGIHQAIREKPKMVKDLMGWDREEELPATGPHRASKNDFSFTPDEVLESKDQSGIIPPVPVDDGKESGWYTVYGKRQKDKGAALNMGKFMAALGSFSFLVAMRKDL